MNTHTANPNHKTYAKQICAILTIVLFGFNAWAQDPIPSDSTGFSLGQMELPDPDSIQSKYTYDPITDRYIYSQTVGEFSINYPIILTPKEYQALVLKENLRNYYKEKVKAFDGNTDDAEEKQKNLLPEFYINSGFFESIFGGNTIEVIPQGSVEMDLGILYTKQDNPSFSPRNQSNFTFDFDQRISLSLLGKVGTRLQVTANYDTESTFDFQNLIKLEYTPTEDDIIQKIEVGNVNMPINSSLITGAQSLFGVKTQLQFGKTTITGVFSEQRSDTRSVVAQGGGTLEEFDFFIRDYDENRHFFLAQYFRDEYDDALANYPFINNNIQITRIEVWVTNRNNRIENVRNVVALQDIGESQIIGNPVVNVLQPNPLPDNPNNGLNPENIGGAGSQLTEAVRNIPQAQLGLPTGFSEGVDYAKLENARKLNEGQEFTLNTQLGYISLNQRLNNDETLAVAFQYTVGGQVYQVGEFANDGVPATDVETGTQGEVTNVVNNAIVLKMLKSPITNVTQPVWDLMMKNVYDTGAFQLSQEDFRLNIFYTEASPLNYITPVNGSFARDINGNPVTSATPEELLLQNNPLLRVFRLDRLNFNNDPQQLGDGFFDFVPGITVIPQNGKIIFTSAEPFGEYLFNVLSENITENYDDPTTYNENQEKYVYDILYSSTKTAALDEVEKNKFQIKGRYTSEGGDGIPIGAFNVPRGSVVVTAGGRTLVEGVDYTVNYQLGRVYIVDESLKASNIPIQVSTENNAIFGQQTKRFTGINVEHKFNENFVMGATYLSLNERPITQKANFGTEPINNKMFGINGNFSTELPFLTRLVNKLPNTDTDVMSNLSVRGEFAYLLPGSPKGTEFGNEATSYVDDFEGTQNGIDIMSPLTWALSSRPVNLPTNILGNDNPGIQNGYGRALLNWYTIDPTFYGGQRPGGITDQDMSSLYTSRVFINELFPQQDIAQGQTTVINTLDLAYYPNERGPYNFQTTNIDVNTGIISQPQNSWAGISRQLTSTDFEQANVEYIEFWLQDPFQENPANAGGKLVFNLGSISEDVLKDGRKLYENGLPQDGNVLPLQQLSAGGWNNGTTVVPLNQSLVYAFDTTGAARTNQDVGYDGLNDIQEAAIEPVYQGVLDPSNDNYTYFLNTTGNVFERYKRYNNVQGNSPEAVNSTNRGNTTQPDVEDINRDNTMNTIDSYFEYELALTRQNLPQTKSEFENLPSSNPIAQFLVDYKDETPRVLPNGQTVNARWYQFRVPIEGDHAVPVGGISDLRSIRFIRMYLKEFQDPTVFRFGSLDLVRSDWRRFTQSLQPNDPNAEDDNTDFYVGAISLLENDGSYALPPGVQLEQLANNNNIIRQNEQSLVVNVCDLQRRDSRAVFKNINVDMRRYEKLRMFMHAENGDRDMLASNDLVGFIRMGNDLTQNYYQIEVPLQVVEGIQGNPFPASTQVWPLQNEINIDINLLSKIKSIGISEGTLSNPLATFYDVVNGQAIPVPTNPADPNDNGEFDNYVAGQQRIGVKGNPNFGDIRMLMVGVKNISSQNRCGEVWFNELRLSGLDSEGGWAAVLGVDANLADFATVSATGRKSTVGFGSIEQGPTERSIEDVEQYDVVTNINVGQLLPKKWGLQIPFNYSQGEELVTPKYDQQYRDIELDDRLNTASSEAEKDLIREQSEDYTKRRSINFIGVRKNRTGDAKPRFYDVENFTVNYSYNKLKHRDFEIENMIDQNVRLGANYAYNFQPKSIEPFKKNDSLFTGKYWKFLKEFNINLLPTSVAVNADYNRQFNRQKFRDLDLTGSNIGIDELFRRNYTFDFQYNINYNLTKSLQVNFSAANNNIVRNYFVNDNLQGRQDPDLDVWDGFFDVGDPNRQSQQLGINYQIPINKIPTFSFITANYSYSGDFQWQKGSDLLTNIDYTDPVTNITTSYDLGNTVQNANTHNLNTTLDMKKFYRYIGLVKRNRTTTKRKTPTPPGKDGKIKKPKKLKKTSKLMNTVIDVATMVKRVQFNYSENNGTFLPGYLRTPGFIGTLKPSFGYTFGSQKDIRQDLARRGWLTQFPEFNQQYTSVKNKQLDYTVNVEPLKDLKIDLIGSRTLAENYSENFRVDSNLEYQSLTPNSFGNFNISTALIKTAFSKSDENNSAAFDDFRANRLEIARRLAAERGIDLTNPANFENGDVNGYPLGYGKNNQAVLLPAFLSAYTGQSASKVKLGALRSFPIPNWDIKYTGLMKLKWFKKRFKRFSLTHGYRSLYTINQFRRNLDFNAAFPNELDQGGNYKNPTIYSNVNLSEMFSPLIRIDMEMKNSVRVLAEVKKDRLLSLSFDNNLLTEIQGKEYILGLGYRIKDVRIKSKLAGPRKAIVSDLNLKADVSLRDNKTIVRYLDLDNSQVTSGQSIWSAKFTADYAFSKNFTGLFYFDYAFSEYAISTAFPQTTIRSGFTLRYNFGN